MTRTDGAYRIFAHGIVVHASIGLLDTEQRRRQPLSVDIDVYIVSDPLADDSDMMLDYRELVSVVRQVAEAMHTRLVESFARRVAVGCLALSGAIERAIVTVRKPGALAPAVAGVTLEVAR